jgi:LysR family transcriptional regulator, hypochlorite-specific transcription factor HypT
MDLRQLESFLALAESGSFTRAAARQHLSQPAFSRRIRALEHWAGADLVDRSTYPVTLTPAGQQLRRRAAGLLEGLEEVRDEVRGYRQTLRDAVRVVTSHALAFGWFSRWWRGLSPDAAVPCRLTVSNTIEAYDTMAAGASDLLLTYTYAAQPVILDPAEFEYVTVGTDTFWPYALRVGGRPKFRLPGTERRPVPLLDYGEQAFFGRIVDDILRTVPQPPHLETTVITDLSSSLCAMAADGLGLAWLPGILTATRGADLMPAGRGEWRRQLEIRLYRARETAGERPLVDRVWQGAAGVR